MKIIPTDDGASARQSNAILESVRGFTTVASVLVTASLVLSACGSAAPAGPSDRELLVAIMEGSPSDAEVEAKLTTADMLCGLDPEVLQAIWADLDRTQFEFQEFTFQHRCPKEDTFLLDLRNAKRQASTTTTSTTSTTQRRRTTTTRRVTTTSTSGSTSTTG